MEELKKTVCQEVRYEGLYNIKGLLPYNIKREWSLQRNNIKFTIEIITALNQKAITIKACKPVKFTKMFELLSNILKYECLYDGRFFSMELIRLLLLNHICFHIIAGKKLFDVEPAYERYYL